MNKLVAALSGSKVWARRWKSNTIDDMTPELPWGFVGNQNKDPVAPRPDDDSHAELERRMLKFCGQDLESFCGQATEMYSWMAKRFSDPDVDFINLKLTAPPLSRALNDHVTAFSEAGMSPKVETRSLGCYVADVQAVHGAADVEGKVMGIWTPRELRYYLRAGADGPEAEIMMDRAGTFPLQRVLAKVVFEVDETFTARSNDGAGAASGARGQHVSIESDGVGHPAVATPPAAASGAQADLDSLRKRLMQVRHKMATGLHDAGAVADEFAQLRAAIGVATEASAQEAAGRVTSQATAGEAADAGLVAHRTTHTWVFETDRPHLNDGEGPLWRVININDALRV